jgi:hypothetical protein
VKGLGLGLGLPDPKAPKRRAGAGKQPPPRGACAKEALEELTRETREAVRGLETATGGVPSLDDDAMIEEFVKQFEEFAGAQVPFLLPVCSKKITSKSILLLLLTIVSTVFLFLQNNNYSLLLEACWILPLPQIICQTYPNFN